MADSEELAEDKSQAAGGQSGSDDGDIVLAKEGITSLVQSANTTATGASKAASSGKDGPNSRTLNKAADDEEGEESEAKDKEKGEKAKGTAKPA